MDHAAQQQMVAIVLAGGKSRRMGHDKSRLILHGQSFMDRVKQAAMDAGLPVRAIRSDNEPGRGPLGGVLTAWDRFRAETMLFLSCDMPFLDGEILRHVAMRFDPKKGALFTLDEERPGFPFILTRSTQPLLRTLFNSGADSVREFAQAVDADLWQPPVRWRRRFSNINTPAEWVAAQGRK